MRAIFLVLSLLMGSTELWAQSFDEHIVSQRMPRHSIQPSRLRSQIFSQAIDHAAPNGPHFSQRYWVNSQYASGPDAPVIYHMCGEGDVDDSYFLNDSAIQWAKELGAHLVYLEHRYYGQSSPFNDLSAENLQYLTLDNVMEDLATFQQWLMAQQNWSGKWIAVGGSYSGTMAALYRQKHPELVVGALASSAPMISGKGSSSGGDLEGDPWSYQACTQLGYWLADSAGRDGELEIPSREACSQAFPGAPFADYGAYNEKYDQPFLMAAGGPSNILFTYGADDVWTNLGLSEQTNSNAGITISMIAGAGHHFDLNAPSAHDAPAVIAARSQFLALARMWLGQKQAL